MGVDYDGIGGIGVEVDSSDIISSGKCTEEQWDEDSSECMDSLGVKWANAGDENYGGDGRIYLMVEGETLGEITANSDEFCKKLSALGIDILPSELKIISDLYVW